MATHGTVTFPHLKREAQSRLQVFLCHVGEDLPALEERGTDFSAAGSYEAWFLAVRAMPSGFVGVHWTNTQFRFCPRSANPLW